MNRDPFIKISREIVQHIADSRLDLLNYYPDRTTQKDLARVLNEYGRTVVPLPDAGVAEVDVFRPFTDEKRWLIEFPLWTREEGRSDLCLYLIVLEQDGQKVGYIDDIRVP